MRLTSFQKTLWSLAGIGGTAFVLGLFWMDYRDDQGRTSEAHAFEAAFELTDHQGIVRNEEDFIGRWMLIFFGFANCPDICPTTLAEVAAVMEGLGEEAQKLQPIFISIDPERDTPKALADFVPRFDAGILGLTGTPEQIDATTNVAFSSPFQYMIIT